jgi:alpha-glucosidase
VKPHHDGSEAYVLERPDELGGSATVRLRVPHGTPVDDVALRAVRDGEPRVLRAELDEATETDTWYREPSRSTTRARATAGFSQAATSTTPG